MKGLAVLMILFTISSVAAFAIQDDPQNRATASQSHIVNAQGEQVNQVLVDEQVLVVADVTNAQDRQQPFVYIVQIQNNDDIVVSLGWLEGALSQNQRLSPALSWTPQYPGVYSITVFVWESISNPSALSPTLQMDVDVSLAEL